jgi:hypothetical protein
MYLLMFLTKQKKSIRIEQQENSKKLKKNQKIMFDIKIGRLKRNVFKFVLQQIMT